MKYKLVTIQSNPNVILRYFILLQHLQITSKQVELYWPASGHHQLHFDFVRHNDAEDLLIGPIS